MKLMIVKLKKPIFIYFNIILIKLIISLSKKIIRTKVFYFKNKVDHNKVVNKKN